MWRVISTGMVLLGLLAAATPAQAQDHGFSVSLGYFAPRGEDSRVSGDVLNANRCIDTTFLCEPLLFEVDDFGGLTIGGEYLIGIGKYVEAGVGVGFYQQTVPTIYEFVTRPDDTEIDQDLKLRIVPLTATLKFVPTGRDASFQPYIGAGIAALFWSYSETGEFVDAVTSEIFRDSFTADGTEVAPVIFGGLRAPVGASMMLGGEVRYQKADAELPVDDFLGDRLDLGGLTFQANLTWRF
jgi:Outer membrane protein beta-barrel domain